MHANFQGSSIKTEDFFWSDRVTALLSDRVSESDLGFKSWLFLRKPAKNEATLFSQTLKVEENKVALFLVWPVYGRARL